jgi:hypothetical protein
MAGRAAIALALGLTGLAACSRGAPPATPGGAGREAPANPGGPAATVDWDHPVELLAMDAGEAARRVGSFEWAGTAGFTVTTQGDGAARVQVGERHRVRQAANGEFEADAEIDEGRGPGGLAGKHVVFSGGLTYAHAQFAPWRERPTDHGRDARRFRDESFTMAGDLARLYGPALQLTPTGQGQLLGRAARRYLVSLAGGATAVPAGSDRREFAAGGPDEETRRHLAFLDGRVPLAASGEVLFDAATGVPLQARLQGAFSVKDDPRLRIQVEVAGEVRAVGPGVGAVTAPRNALKDSRKPPGVALALERAGFKSRDKAAAAAEPADEPEGP